MSPVQMTTALLSLVFISPAVSHGIVIAGSDSPNEPVLHEIIVTQEDGEPIVIKLDGIEGGNAAHTVAIKALVATEGEDAPHFLTLVARSHDIKPGGPWLGIQFGPVPKPLAGHLRLAPNAGQMVLNVIEDSPADRAGLKQYDVIVNIDGEQVTDDLGGFLKVVQGFSPDEQHTFSLVRDGVPTQATLTIGTRPEAVAAAKYKYEFDFGQNEPLGGMLFRRGGLLEKDDQGIWCFNRFDQTDDLKNIWNWMPQIDSKDFTFRWIGGFPDAHKQMGIHFGHGSTVRIERGDGGRITVTKTGKENGEETTSTQTYANEEEFEANDPETYKTYKNDWHFGVEGGLQFHKLGFGPMGLHGGIFLHKEDDGDLNVDVDLDLDVEDLLKKVEEAAKAHGGAGKLFNRYRTFSRSPGSHEAHVVDFFKHKASASFEVESDGTIRVTTRDAHDELVEVFDNADQLKIARPELYEKFQNLKEAQIEEPTKH